MKPLILTIAGAVLITSVQFLPGLPTVENVGVTKWEKISQIKAQAYPGKQEIAKVPRACPDYLSLVQKYDWNVSIAIAIMKAESGCNTESIGDTWAIGGIYAPSCGLMQIRTLKGRPSCSELQKPDINLEWAYRLYKANGFQPWTKYNDGSYLQYL